MKSNINSVQRKTLGWLKLIEVYMYKNVKKALYLNICIKCIILLKYLAIYSRM